ncbi:turripeptide Lol9.1 [Schistocerca piceifrons]|uniref:turripeptide Lol9.1 n=1 Tax=Schistocerca piceifrons TaxID=274613 RepID=UPI001F5E88DB|nr:turripeptide Lol9.1 [Schistocerca piceifrons]
MNTVVAILLVALVACAHAQLGSVHCGVGCACSQGQQPVCGNNGVTYLNECELRCAQCDLPGLLLAYAGVCVPAVTGYAPPPQYQYAVPVVYGKR